MSMTVVLSGPEKSRARAELAIEDLGDVAILPEGHHARWVPDRVEDHETHKLAPLPTLDKKGNRVKPKEPHGFITLHAADADALNAAVDAVAKHKWVLRMHGETPPEPQPSPEQLLIARLDDMQAEIDRLKAGRF